MKCCRGLLLIGATALALGCGGSAAEDDDDVGGDDGPDAGAVPDADPDRPDAGPPAFPVDEGTWVFMPVDGTRCMDGSPTGMGLNLNAASNDVVIYLEGGGACFNQFTCNGVAHQNGFDEATLESVVRETGDRGLFDREDPDNPFRDWNYVFLPYCTGDIFAGAAEQGYGGRVQVGYQNVGAYLDELVPAFDRAERVVLSGSSAGGFGALYNYDRTQQAFGGIPVHLLDDSGPPLPDDYLKPCLQSQIRNLWNIEATLPEDCEACDQEDGGGLVNVIPFLADKYPDRRFGLISSTRDGVIRLFFGWGWPSCGNPDVPMPEQPFAEGIGALLDDTISEHDNFNAYVIDSGLHVWLFEVLSGVQVGDAALDDWIDGLLTGEDWRTVSP